MKAKYKALMQCGGHNHIQKGVSILPYNVFGTIGSIPLKDPNFRYIPWTPHVIDSCGPTCK
jgi:hypothetical protein